MKQLQKLDEGNWNNLIILDACRYDYFERDYTEFLNGSLTKVLSPASCTINWLKTAWPGVYDVTYVSSWPGVNSKGVPRHGYNAAHHFTEIIDVWDLGWSEELGTVPPWVVNRWVLNFTDRQDLIVHYMQPHQPYIGETKITFPNVEPGFSRTSKRIRKRIIAGEINFDLLKRAYRDNLRLVLKWVTALIPHLNGKTVVTADHGELLDVYYGRKRKPGPIHPCKSKDPLLRHVPWLEVDG